MPRPARRKASLSQPQTEQFGPESDDDALRPFHHSLEERERPDDAKRINAKKRKDVVEEAEDTTRKRVRTKQRRGRSDDSQLHVGRIGASPSNPFEESYDSGVAPNSCNEEVSGTDESSVESSETELRARLRLKRKKRMQAKLKPTKYIVPAYIRECNDGGGGGNEREDRQERVRRDSEGEVAGVGNEREDRQERVRRESEGEVAKDPVITGDRSGSMVEHTSNNFSNARSLPPVLSGTPACGSIQRLESHNNSGSGLLSNETAMMTHIVKDAVSKMEKRCDATDQKVLAFAEETRRRFDEIIDIVNPMLTVVVALKGDNAGRRKRRSPLEGPKRQELIDARVAVLDLLLSHEVLQHIMEQVLIGRMSQYFAGKHYSTFGEIGAEFWRAIMFSKQPQEERTKYETVVGKRHSSFRMSLLLTTLHTLQVDSLGLFVLNDGSKEHKVEVTRSNAEGSLKGCGSFDGIIRIPQPHWLKPRYIHKEHCEIARKSKEEVKVGKKTKERQSDELIKKDEVAIGGAARLYTIITEVLRSSRAALKKAFFEEVGFLVCSWATHNPPVSQDTMKLWWEVDDLNTVSFEDIVESGVMDFADRTAQVCEDDADLACNKRNIGKLKKLVSDHPYLIMLAEYEVIVRSEAEVTTQSSRHPRSSIRRICRAINLLDVAMKVMSAFTGIGSVLMPVTFVSCHKNTMKCAFVLAKTMRELMDVAVTEFRLNGVSWKHDDASLLSKNAYGLTWKELMPSATTQKSSLNSNILSLSPEEYKKIHVEEGAEFVDLPEKLDMHICSDKNAVDLADGADVFEITTRRNAEDLSVGLMR